MDFIPLNRLKTFPSFLLGHNKIRFMTLYRRQGSIPSPRKRNAERQNGYLRRPYKYLRKEGKLKAKEKRKDISI